MSETNCFGITLYLHAFFNDYRSLSRIYINENMKYVSDLELHITKIYKLRKPIYLSAQCYYLPSSEDIRIIQKNDVIVVNRKIELMCDDSEQESCEQAMKRRRYGSPCVYDWKRTKNSTPKKRKFKKKCKLLNENNDEGISFLELLPENSFTYEKGQTDKKKVKKEKKNKERKSSTSKYENQLDDCQQNCLNKEKTSNTEKYNMDYSKDNISEEKNNLTVENLDNTIQNSEHDVDMNDVEMNEIENNVMSVNNDIQGNIKEDVTKNPKSIIIRENLILNSATANVCDEHPPTENKMPIANTIEEQNQHETKSNDIQLDSIIQHNENDVQNLEEDTPQNNISMQLQTTSISIVKPFTVSNVMQLIKPNNDSESTIEPSIKCRRKRIRKRKKKKLNTYVNDETDTSSYVNNFDSTMMDNNIILSTNKPSSHIRFNDSDENNEDDTDEEKTPEPEILKQTTVYYNSKENDNNLDAPLSAGVIKNFPKMENKKPNKSDVIGFKVLKMSEDYTPAISQYVVGKVLSYDVVQDLVQCEILYGKDELKEPIGKFSLNEETLEVEEDSKPYFKLADLKDVRLIFP